MNGIYGFSLVFILLFSVQPDPWVAPGQANDLKNPLENNSKSIQEGKRIFQSLCWTCHGQSGKGDGPAGVSLNPKPASFSAEAVQLQSDGAIFWKISEGRGAMGAYKNNLSTTQRWQLGNYVRTLTK